MSDDLPAPLVAADVDLSKLDGFLLNVEKLLGSELAALSTGDEFKAAIMLLCRAWKQRPACSLPDDDRVLASFAGNLPAARWRKLRPMALRGWEKCSDGRLYHRVLAADGQRAWREYQRYLARREADRKRLNGWRQRGDETASETQDETRFTDAMKRERNADETRSKGKCSSSSVAKATDADASIEPIFDPARVLFSTGVKYLMGHGFDERQARGLIGKWRSQHGDEATIGALGEVSRRAVSEPVSAMEEAFQRRTQAATAARRKKQVGFC